MREVILLVSFYRWGSWGTERFSNLAGKLMADELRCQPRRSGSGISIVTLPLSLMASFTCYLAICVSPQGQGLHGSYLWNPPLTTPIEFCSCVFNNIYWINNSPFILNYLGLELQQQILAPSSGERPGIGKTTNAEWLAAGRQPEVTASTWIIHVNVSMYVLCHHSADLFTCDLITKASHLVYEVNTITNPKQIKSLGILKGSTKQNTLSWALPEKSWAWSQYTGKKSQILKGKACIYVPTLNCTNLMKANKTSHLKTKN